MTLPASLRPRAHNPLTGDIIEFRDGQWVSVGNSNALEAAESTSLGQTVGVGIASAALNARDSVRDFLANFSTPEGERALKLRAQLDHHRRAELLQPLREQNPIAFGVGEALATAPLFVGAGFGAASARGLIGREAAAGAAEGFFRAPGSMAERVQRAALGGGLGATGAGAFLAAGAGVRAARGIGGARQRALTDETPLLAEGDVIDNDITDAFIRQTEPSAPLGPAANVGAQRRLNAPPQELPEGSAVTDAVIPEPGDAARAASDAATGRGEMGSTLATSVNLNGVRHLAERQQALYDEMVAATPIAANHTRLDRELLRFGDEHGYVATEGWRMNRKALRDIEAGLAGNPNTGGPFARMHEANDAQFMNDTASYLGIATPENAGQFTPGMLGDTRDVLQRGYDDFEGKVGPVTFDQRAIRELKEIRDTYARGYDQSPDVAPVVQRFLDDVEGATDSGVAGVVDIKKLLGERSKFNTRLRNLAETDANAFAAYREMLTTMDEAIYRDLRRRGLDSLADDWRLLNEKWRFVKALERANVITDQNKLNPKALRRALNAIFKEEFRRSDMGRDYTSPGLRKVMGGVRYLTRFRDLVPNSGTPTRQFIQRILTNPIAGFREAVTSATVGRAAFRATQGRSVDTLPDVE